MRCAPTTKMMRWGGPALGLTLVALMIVVMVGTFLWLTNYVEARAADVATQIGATLVYVNVGIGLLLLFFGLAFLTMWAVCVAARQHKVQGFRSSVAGMLNPHPGVPARTKLFMKWVMISREVPTCCDSSSCVKALICMLPSSS